MTHFENTPKRRLGTLGQRAIVTLVAIAMAVLAFVMANRASLSGHGQAWGGGSVAPSYAASGAVQMPKSAATPTSADLADFLVSATFNAPQDDNGTYVITPGTAYTFRLSFQERYGSDDTLQFLDRSTMAYAIPEGLEIANGHSGTFTIKIRDGAETYLVEGNSYDIQGGFLRVDFNAADPNFDKLTAAANVRFTLEFQGRLLENADKVLFSDGIEKSLTVDSTNSVTASKSAQLDKANNRVNYAVTVHSLGRSTDVHVRDAISGAALSLDTASISATSSTGQPVTMTGGPQGNGFEYVIPAMADNEFVTLTYSAIIDPLAVPSVNGRRVTVGENAVEVWSTGDPDPDRREVTTTIDYTPTIDKSDGTLVSESGSIKTLSWVIEANQNPVLPMAGTTITDTIGSASQPIMRYSGDGLTVVVKDAAGTTIRTDHVAWGQLASKTDSSWAYVVPPTDANKAYSYTISYTTDVDMAGKVSATTVDNDVTTSGGESSSGSGQVLPAGGEVVAHKEVVDVDMDGGEITWRASFNVPSDGLTSAEVLDMCPRAYDADGITCWYEPVKEGSVTVTGLVGGETYAVAYGQPNTTITFYQDENKTPGLRGAGPRTVIIELKTPINGEWLEASMDYNDDAGRGGLTTHTNTIQLHVNGDYKTTTASTTLTLPEVTKTVQQVGTRTVNGIELPIYMYEVVVTGVESDDIEIQDEFDTDLLTYYEGDYPDAGHVYGGTVNWQSSGNARFNRLDTAGGMTISTNSDCLPHVSSGVRHAAYRFVYYLTVKGAAALNTIKERAAAADDGKYSIGNTATFMDGSNTVDVTYEYDGLKKEILTPDSELRKTDDDIWAEFRITLNSGGMLLNGGEDLVMTDTVSNLSVDVNSIRANPPAGVSWDMRGNTVTYAIPDGMPIVITYRARVIMSSVGEEGDTQQINFSNHAEMKCYDEDISKMAEYTNSGGYGSGSLAAINLLKYRAGDMTQTLSGALFQLQDSNGTPIRDKDGNPVEFTTGPDGKISIKGNMDQLGWVIEENVQYLLEEKLAPEGFMLAGHKYRFTVSDDGTTDYGQYVYYSGDTMTVKDYPGTDVRVRKVWSDGNGNHASDEVVVRLQQSVGGGAWSDTIRHEDADGAWVEETGMEVALNATNGWEGIFGSLPLAVPTDMGDPDGSADAAADYRVAEVSVNGDPLAEVVLGTGGMAEGTGTYVYTVTNGVARTGELEVTKAVESDEEADHAAEFGFTVTLKAADGTTDTTISGAYGDMAFDGGIATFTLKDGDSKVARNLPQGIAYTVTETATEGFVTTVGQEDTNEASGTISDTRSVAAFTNRREDAETGGLTVEKIVSSHTSADEGAAYDFVVRLDDETISGRYGEMEFDGGVARFSLTDRDIRDGDGKSTGTKTAEGLPVGIGYVVSEEAEGFTVTSSGATGQIATAAGDATPTYPTATFTNTRNEGALTLSKVVTGATEASAGKEYRIAVVLRNADGSDATIVNDEHDGIAFDHGHAVVTLEAGESKTITGLPQGLSYEVTEVTEDVDGNLVSRAPDGFATSYAGRNGTIAAEGSAATVTNAYRASGETHLEATKAIAGRPFAAGDEWVFSLRTSDGAPLPRDAAGNEVTEVTIAPTGGVETPVDFGTIRYTAADLGGKRSAAFTYTIAEATGKDEDGSDKVTDIINDHAKVVTVEVFDNGDGTLDVRQSTGGAAITDERPLTFTNTYQVKETLQAYKKLEGRDWQTDAASGRRESYGFEIVATGDSLTKMEHSLVSAKAYTYDEAQPATFGEFSFTTADAGKTFTYIVREIVPDDAVNPDGVAYGAADLVAGRHGPWTKDGVTYSESQFEVRYAVSTDLLGRLKVDRTCSPEAAAGITFTNTYGAKEVTQEVVAAKSLRGGTLAAGDFQFRLYDVSREKEYLARNGLVTDANGTPVAGEATNAIVFDRIDAFDSAGRYTFELSEVIPDGVSRQTDGTLLLDGVAYDPTTYEVTIDVTDDMLGHLVASAPTYKAKGSGAGATATPPTFANACFKAEVGIAFGKQFYGHDASAKFGFTLTAAEGEGFVPRRHDPGADITLDASAYGEGNPLVDRGEAFRLSLENDGPFDAAGHATVTVPAITYHAPGTYRYVITEDEVDASMSGDIAELLVTVVVGTDGTAQPPSYAIRVDGEVTPVGIQDACFYNNDLVAMSFRARALRTAPSDEADRTAKYMPKARKVLAGGTLRGEEFSFTLRDADGNPLSTVPNDANGVVAFGTLVYGSEDAGRTFTYTIAENPGSDAAIKYDTHPIMLKVSVGEAEDGALVVDATYELTDAATGNMVETDDPVIVNAYDTIVIHAVKRTREFNEDGTINNEAEGLPGAHYGLWMVNPDGEDVYMGLGRNQVDEEGSKLESDANGNLYYDIPMLQGVAYYFLEEAPAPAGHLVDPYPTDYFTLVHDENGFRLVYEHDEPDADGKVFSDYVTGL